MSGGFGAHGQMSDTCAGQQRPVDKMSEKCQQVSAPTGTCQKTVRQMSDTCLEVSVPTDKCQKHVGKISEKCLELSVVTETCQKHVKWKSLSSDVPFLLEGLHSPSMLLVRLARNLAFGQGGAASRVRKCQNV